MRPTCTGGSTRMWTLLLPPAFRTYAARPMHQQLTSAAEWGKIRTALCGDFCLAWMFGQSGCDCTAGDDLCPVWIQSARSRKKREKCNFRNVQTNSELLWSPCLQTTACGCMLGGRSWDWMLSSLYVMCTSLDFLWHLLTDVCLARSVQCSPFNT